MYRDANGAAHPPTLICFNASLFCVKQVRTPLWDTSFMMQSKKILTDFDPKCNQISPISLEYHLNIRYTCKMDEIEVEIEKISKVRGVYHRTPTADQLCCCPFKKVASFIHIIGGTYFPRVKIKVHCKL